MRRHPEVSERKGGWGGGEPWDAREGVKRKARNSSHSPLVFSRFLKRQLRSRSSEVRKQRGNGRGQPEEEERILEGTRHLRQSRIETLKLRLHYVRGCSSSSSSSSSFFSLCYKSPLRLILKSCSVCLIQMEAPRLCTRLL